MKIPKLQHVGNMVGVALLCLIGKYAPICFSYSWLAGGILGIGASAYLLSRTYPPEETTMRKSVPIRSYHEKTHDFRIFGPV